MSKTRLERINELAHKAKTEGLTPEEMAERDVLRKEYVAAVLGNVRAQLAVYAVPALCFSRSSSR